MIARMRDNCIEIQPSRGFGHEHQVNAMTAFKLLTLQVGVWVNLSFNNQFAYHVEGCSICVWKPHRLRNCFHRQQAVSVPDT